MNDFLFSLFIVILVVAPLYFYIGAYIARDEEGWKFWFFTLFWGFIPLILKSHKRWQDYRTAHGPHVTKLDGK